MTRPGDSILEIGCGTGYLAIELARQRRLVTGVDVSKVALDVAQSHAKNLTVSTPSFELLAGLTLPFPDGAFDFAYSVETVEHMHPDDVPSHLAEVCRVLRSGGAYWILTPDRVMHRTVAERFGIDAVNAIDDVHLKEWTYAELRLAVTKAGFGRIRSPWRNSYLPWLPLLPVSAKELAERIVIALPASMARAAAMGFGTASCSIIATKS
jgi:ubiquinone/menaquinone biosynthesis C-methylase UbiE